MSQEHLNEREFELINIIGAKLGSNQRDLSRYLDLSLGLTNMLIRRLMAKGYIRMRQLNKRKAEYILTPKGFGEKYQKSINYTLKTIHSIGLIRERLNSLLHQLYAQGQKSFFLLGDSDLAGLVEMACREFQHKDIELKRIKQIPAEELKGVIIICREQTGIPATYQGQCVNLIEVLAQDYAFVGLEFK